MTATSSASLWTTSPAFWTSISGVLDAPAAGVGEGEQEVVQLVVQREPNQ